MEMVEEGERKKRKRNTSCERQKAGWEEAWRKVYQK
jgi:hypothetical protein